MVLTQREISVKAKAATKIVSIPLWFLRNLVLETGKRRGYDEFPYHYGSYATSIQNNITDVVQTFPYHYGSYATLLEKQNIIRELVFPYHYGSYATNPVGFVKRVFGPEFPYHYGSYATEKEVKGNENGLCGFHTTMVLTQRA